MTNTNRPRLSDNAAKILLAFEKIAVSNYALLFDLRVALPELDRGAFDAAVRELRLADMLSLDSSDGRHRRLTAEQRAAGIQECGSNLVLAQR